MTEDASPGLSPAEEGESGADTNGYAIASMFLSIVWIFGVGSILGIVLGYRGLREIRESRGEQGGRAFALAGLWIGVLGLGSLALMIYFGVYAAGANKE